MMLILTCVLALLPPQVSGWEIFTNTRFEWRFLEDQNMQAEVPIFDEKVRSLEGQEIQLTGYYLPVVVSRSRIIISKLPYASCFFCGGGVGMESVAEIQFDGDAPRFKLDELVTVRGQLKLNDNEYDQLVFILTDASIVSE